MAEAKTPLALVPPVSSLDTVVGVRDDGTGAQIVQLTTSNLAALLQLDAGGLVRSSWTQLETIVGSYDGQPARVLGDSGHHNDPVTSGHPQVDNEGDYGWVAASSAWQWLRGLSPTQADVAAAVAAEAALRTAADSSEQTARIAGDAAEATARAAADATEQAARIAGDAALQSEVDTLSAELQAPLEAVSHLALYSGSGDITPIAASDIGQIILGVDRATGALVGDGVGETPVNRVLGAGGIMRYIGDGAITPIVTDSFGRILLGVDRETGEGVGLFAGGVSSSSGDPNATPAPIASVAKNHLLFYGQSLTVGAAAGAVLSTTQPYVNLTFSGGPRAWSGTDWDFASFKALVEDAVAPAPDGYSNRAETMCSGAANYASTCLALAGVAPSDHVILASTAGHGGYRIDQLAKGSAWYDNFKAHVTGAHLLDASHAVQTVGYGQGESDADDATPYASYYPALAQLRSDMDADIRAITGQSSPVYMLLYQSSYGARTHSDIALAHLHFAQSSDYAYLVAPTYAFPYADDHTHLTAVGYKWLGAYYGRAYAAIARGKKPVWLDPVSATVRGALVRVRFTVPTLPLVLDATNLASTTDKGFKVLDGASPATISSIAVSGSDVLITLSAAPSDVVTVRYALDALGAGISIVGGASGNLRDSTPDIITISGTDYPLYHVCPAFELVATKLGE